MVQPIKDFVDVNITRETATVTQLNFGIPLIAEEHSNFPERTKIVRTLDDILALGFTTSSQTYLKAQKLLSQNKQVERIILGRLDASVQGVSEVVFDAPLVTDNIVNGTVNGVSLTPVPFDTDDATTLTNLALAIAALDGIASAVIGPNKVIVTFEEGFAGSVSGFAVTGGASQAGASEAVTTAAKTVSDSLSEIQSSNNTWYKLLLCSNSVNDNLAAAAFIESSPSKKVFAAYASSADIIDDVSTDLASRLKALNYDRTFVTYGTGANEFPAAAILGAALPEDPGSFTYNLLPASGVTAEDLDSGALAAVADKNVNFFTSVAGSTAYTEGKVASGEFIDVINGSDWIEGRMSEDIFTTLLNSKKVPYTEAGLDLVENQIRKRLKLASDRGIITEDSIVVNRVPVADTPTADKGNRVYGGFSWSATLQGAIHKLVIRGTVSL